MADPKAPGRFQIVVASLLILIVFLPLVSHPALAPAESKLAAGLASLQVQKIKATLEFLASRNFKGRATGTPASELTAAYIASVFQHQGLIPLAKQESSYIQEFELTQALPRDESFLHVESEGSLDSILKMREDYVPAPWGKDNETVGAELVFVGYGLRAAELHYDDYAGMDVRGRIVVALNKMPSSGAASLSSHFTRADYEDPLEKARVAQNLGASGMLLVLQPAEELPYPKETDVHKAQIYLRRDVQGFNIPCMVLTFKAGETLIQGAAPKSGEDLASIKRAIDEHQEPKSFAVARKATVNVRYDRLDFAGYNVIGKIPGSDPALKEQAVLISAHHDHLGEAENQEIFYGADDDASGTTGVLELAAAFQQNPVKPERSILLAAWGAEEVGLLGSKYYISNPLYPLRQTIAQIQLDMIGRDEDRPGNPAKSIAEEKPEANLNSVSVNGSPFSHDLRRALETSNREVKLELKFRYDSGEENLIKRSDHWPFLKAGIPSLLLFTGFHPDYHKTSDTAEKIDYPKMERILKLVYLTAWELADHTKSPDYSDEPFRQGNP
jgi:hypothetical protein